jgi:hypothetical protein
LPVCNEFGYEVQAAYYVDVAQAIDGKKRDFYWVAVEKDAPFAVAVYKASDAMMEYGRTQYKKAIELYVNARRLIFGQLIHSRYNN